MSAASAGFSREERLLKKQQFQRVYGQGRLCRGRHFWVYFLANNLEYCRLGLSVANRFCPNLVLRNRVKRIVRECYRNKKEAWGPGRDFVVVLKRLPAPLNLSSVCPELLSLLKVAYEKNSN